MLSKTVADSRVETVHMVRPTHLNGANRLFGGILMQWIDEVAGIDALIADKFYLESFEVANC